MPAGAEIRPNQQVAPERRIGGMPVPEQDFRITVGRAGIGDIPGRRRVERGAPDTHPRSR